VHVNLGVAIADAPRRSRHPGGAKILFGDGSVHFAKDSVDPSTWAATETRAGGEVIGNPF
jgi:prepilin-type processing-associated H-X9-DG protein